MKINNKQCVGFVLALMVLVAQRGLAQVAPDLTVSQTQGVKESEFFFLGPTGMKGWMYWYDLTAVARQILVTEVRTNTPAQVAGMQYHDVILGTNNVAFHHDARKAFIEAITDAEGTDGELDLWVYRPSQGATNSVKIQLHITNAPLAATTPYECPKALAILNSYCEYVMAHGPTGSPTDDFSIWAMLGSSNATYVSWATNYIRNVSYANRTNLNIYVPDPNMGAWNLGYQLITLSQYYLYTVDQGMPDDSVLPALTNAALYRAMGQDYRGLVSHTFALPKNNGGLLHGSLPTYGPINASTLAGLYGMILARKCGVQHPEIDAAIEQAAKFYRGHVGIGTINYGFNPPVPWVVDSNGRMGLAAHIFRALGDVEAAKWFAMMTSTYGWRDWGHTGNEFNHAWGPLAASIGGPDLVNFVQTYDWIDFYQVSLNMRRQPEGWFQSQGQAGRGVGRGNGHATGSYALQMAIPYGTIEVTGAGYGTNFWLTADEMAQVEFAFPLESNAGVERVKVFDTPTLKSHLGNFCPKVAIRVANELNGRITADPTLRDYLMDVVLDKDASEMARVAALCALDEEGRTNALVKAEVDTWYAPTNRYVLMYGAINYGYRDKASQLAILETVAQFDRLDTFQMLLAGDLPKSIYSMSTNGWSEAEMDIYFRAVEVILSPDASGSWFVDSQGIKNWPPGILAGYADYVLRVSERVGLTYNAPEMLTGAPYGEGLYSWMVRSGYKAHGPFLDTSEHWFNYGLHGLIYTNQIRNLMASGPNVHYSRWHFEDAALHIQLPAKGQPELTWFRDQIAENVDRDYPGASIADLRGLMVTNRNLDRPLFRAVVLDKIATAHNDTNAFADIVQYVGSKVPIPGLDWRLYRGAIELGTNDTYSTDAQWTNALVAAIASNNIPRITGIFHVLAERGFDVRASAEPYLLHYDDYVAIGALDVYRRTGTQDDLLMLFNQFMTNCSEVVNGVVEFDTAYKIYAYWDAITSIIDRHTISTELANQLAAAFNSVTSNGADMKLIAGEILPRAEPMSILNPTNSRPDKIYGSYTIGPTGILGLFPGTDCDAALQNVFDNNADSPWAGRRHKYAAAEAVLRRHTIAEILAINASQDWSRWNSRHAAMYLLREILLGNVPSRSEQLAILRDTTQEGQNLQSGDRFFSRHYQYELSRKRGLEEEGAIHYIYVK